MGFFVSKLMRHVSNIHTSDNLGRMDHHECLWGESLRSPASVIVPGLSTSGLECGQERFVRR